jgi:putative Mn2+ efflux pump MntP
MVQLITAALLLGLDSAVVSFALGTTGVARPRQRRLAFAFGMCDAAASLAGFYIGSAVTGRFDGLAHWIGPVLVALYALLVLATARSAGAVAAIARRSWPLYLLPVLMSLDNLAFSSSLVHAVPPLACAAVLGIVSGMESVFGFRIGELFTAGVRRLGKRPGGRTDRPLIGGLALLSAAAVLALL